MSDRRAEERVALFVDIENMIGEASRIGLPVELSEVVQKLKEFGSIHVRRSFGDIPKSLDSVGKRHQIDNIRRMLHRNLCYIEDVPYITQNKNSVDVRLVIEALSLAYTDESVTHFAILSSDRDYVPLFNKLHELGRKVIAIGMDPEMTHSIFQDAADHIFYYRNFFTGTRDESEQTEQKRNIRSRYEVLLCRAVQAMENQGKVATPYAVTQRMTSQVPDFDVSLTGAGSFSEFLRMCEVAELIQLTGEPGTESFAVTLSEKGRALIASVETAQTEPPRRVSDPELETRYRRVIEGKLKLPLPSIDQRRAILSAATRTYDELMEREGPFHLLEWKAETVEEMRERPDISEQAIYKTMISLFIARCFHCEVNEDWYNPLIISQAQRPEDWEHAIHRLFVSNIVSVMGTVGLAQAPLAKVLFGSDSEESMTIAGELIEEAKDR